MMESEEMVNEKCSSHTNIIGTHPTEVKTSINPDNGYPMRQENGQRKTGPPPDWPTTRHPPGRGCEVFVGKLPRDSFESELFPLFERCGQIYEMRLMLDFSAFNRGYTFITYTNRDDAKRCVKELNNYEIRPNHFIGVCQSVDNCRLFVGGIPKTKKREEILDQMCQITEGVVDVIVYPSTNDKTKNRGFAFVEYESHRSAAMARRKLLPGNIQLWGQQIAVDWAEPENQVDEDIMANVRILYVRNLMINTTEEQIRAIFEQFKENSIERVKKLKDYAFVHFKERDDALHAMNMLNGSELDGSIIEVTLAKPVDRSQYFRFTRGVSPSTIATNIPFAFPNGGLAQAGGFDFRAYPYFTIPTTSNPTAISMSNGTTIIPIAVNPLQPKNIRRCVNATGRLPANGNTSPPSLNRHPSTNLLSSSSSRPNPAATAANVVHHRGAYYTILRPSSRRNDEKCLEDLYKETEDALSNSATDYIAPSMMILPEQQIFHHSHFTEIPFVPTTFGFHPGTHLFQPATALFPHPTTFLSGHPAGGQTYHHQPLLFATPTGTTQENGPTQQFYSAHPQGNFAFPLLLTPSIAPTTSTNDNGDSSVFPYTPTTTTTTSATTTNPADSSTYSA